MANNTVNQINSPNTVVITDRDQNQILVTQPVTSVLEVGAVGPQGAKGDTGPQGPQGDPGPQGPPGTLEAFEGIIVTGSSIFSGSTEFTNLPTIQVTGSFAVLGTASLNGSGLLTNVFTASYNTFTASYYTDSSSFSTRVTSLEAFSASLDNTFVTETELNAATASLSASIAYLSSSYLASSASFDTRILNNSSSIVLLSGSFLTFSGSYLIDSASFASRITNNSASIVALSSSFLNLSSSFLTNSSSFASRISNNSASISFLSASYVSFSSSYNTGSFSGSFTGNGAGLYNIPSSGIVGLNLSQIASGSATASISPADGFRVNTNTIITGSLTISGSSTLINIGPAVFSGSLIVNEGITGSLLGTSSYATSALSSSYALTASYALNVPLTSSYAISASNALTSSYAFTASYAENAGSGTQIASGSATASISDIDGFRINTKTEVTGSLTVTGGLTASSAIISGDVIVQGTASINTLVVNQTQYTSGSNQLGDAADDTQTLYGTVRIPTGSFTVTGSVFITGSTVSLQGGSFSGSGANLFNIPASGITGLNLSQIATGSVTASVSPGTGSFSIVSGSTNFLFVSSSGNVGIGTSAPLSPLHVVGSIIGLRVTLPIGDGMVISNDASTTYFQALTFDNLARDFNIAGQSIAFRTGTSYSEKLRIFANGNVGINNSTDAGYKLDVSGSGRFSGNLTITGSATNSLLVRGSGATSATNALLVQNSAGTTGFFVRDDGYIINGDNTFQVRPYVVGGKTLVVSNTGHYGAVGISTTSACGIEAYSSLGIDINGQYAASVYAAGGQSGGRISLGLLSNRALISSGTGLSMHASSMLQVDSTDKGFLPPRTNLTSNISAPAQGLITYLTGLTNEGLYYYSSGSIKSWTKVLNDTGSQSISGSLSITAPASTSSAALTIYKSGSTVVDIQGSSGQLFSITDSLTGSLFSVNTVAGLPTIEAFSDNTVNIGKFGVYPIKVAATGTLAVITGSFTGSFTGSVLGTSSFALTASYVNPLTQSLLVSGSATYTFTSGDGLTLNRDGAGNYIQPITQPLVLYSPNSSIYQYINNSGIGINTVPSARLHVRGSGTTSSTTALLVQNANASSSLVVLDNGFVGINTGSAAYNLDVNGTARVVSNLTVNNNIIAGSGVYTPTVVLSATNLYRTIQNDVGGLVIRTNAYGLQINDTGTGILNNAFLTVSGSKTASSALAQGVYFNNTLVASASNDTLVGLDIQPTFTTGSFTNINRLALRTTGNTLLSGSTGTSPALTVYKSGSTVVSIQGSQGELFSITDSLSGSLFSVSNISGLPILEVFSDNTTLIGNYLDPMLVTTQLVTANSGSTTIYSLPTASYDGAFYDYVVRSGSNSRAGQIMAIWSGSSVNYTDNSTTDFGSTANLSFNVIVSGSNMVLRSTVTTGSWTIKTIIRSI